MKKEEDLQDTQPLNQRKTDRRYIRELAAYLIPFVVGLVLSWAAIAVRYISASEWGWKLLVMLPVIGVIFPAIYLGLCLGHLRKGLGRIGWQQISPAVREAILHALRFSARQVSLRQGIGENLQVEVKEDKNRVLRRIKQRLLKRVPLKRFLRSVSMDELQQRGAEELAAVVFERVEDYMLNTVLAISMRWVIVTAILEAVVLLLLW